MNKTLIATIIVAVLAFFILIFLAGASSNEEDVQINNVYIGTVTDKVVKRYEDEDKYLIFVKLQDGTNKVFENTDNMFLGKLNSSDVYGEIEVGKEYRFETYGFRNEFFSMYENIIDVSVVN